MSSVGRGRGQGLGRELPNRWVAAVAAVAVMVAVLTVRVGGSPSDVALAAPSLHASDVAAGPAGALPAGGSWTVTTARR